MKLKPIVWILISLILISSALALGIRPAKTTLDFEPGLEKEYFFNIVNNEHRNLDIKITSEGSLQYYISFDEQEISVSEKEEFRSVKFKLTLPQSLTPGLNLGEIIITENPRKGGKISASLQLSHKVRILAPYPKKYIEMDIQLRTRETESDVIAEIRNSGSETINDLTAELSLYNNKKKLKETKTSSILLKPTQSKQYYLTLDHSLISEGEYDVFANIFYDGEEMEITRKLVAGEPRIEILNLDQFFLEKEINDLRIEMKNHWNKPIERVYAEVLVKKDNKEIYRGKTVSFGIEGNEKKVVKTFIDISGLETGDAELYISMNYNGKVEEQFYKIEIVSKDVFKERIKEIQVRVETLPGGNITIILILIMTLLILGVFLMIIIPPLFKRFKKQPPEQISPDRYDAKRRKQTPDIPEDDIYLPE